MLKTQSKKTYACRSIDENAYFIDSLSEYTPKVGDVGLFEVLSIGKLGRIQSDTKAHRKIIKGDLIIAAFGNRYATGQVEGYVPSAPQDVYHLLGQGGVVGHMVSANELFGFNPTQLKLVGYLCDIQGNVANTVEIGQGIAVSINNSYANSAKIILSIGSSMDSGKTTSAAYLVRGLKTGGHKVAFIKLTGTAYSKDADLSLDMGADISLDFSYLGYPSTYMCTREELLDIHYRLLKIADQVKPEYIVIEIADGVLQRETSLLLNDIEFMSTIHGAMYACGDSLSALGGLSILQPLNVPLIGLTGLFTTSSLLVKEASAHSPLPIYNLQALSTGDIAEKIQPYLTTVQLQLIQAA